jgi:hypothetical protein
VNNKSGAPLHYAEVVRQRRHSIIAGG